MAEKNLSKTQLIQRSINKKYRKEIWNPFIKAIKDYKLIEENDKIAVCISGGKDSMLLGLLMNMLKKYSEVPFELVFLVMNPGYKNEDLENVKKNAEILELPITVFETDIFAIADSVGGTPCYLCARMRRGHLYNKAKELGCNKIALGHHFSDVIETTVMGMFYGSQLQAMLPMLHSTNFEGMSLIRPLYCIHEDNILAWARYNELKFINCACSVTKKNISCEEASGSKRKEIKELIKSLKKDNPLIEKSIFNSIHNVKLDTFVEFSSKGKVHSFLDEFYKEN
ncbi:MAG: tRNA 2-thiocytidine biosynthesis protein TtcA [Clostridia bacterium]|nr:tRNA 2-thiocytidine biosynthesis protein TtcA [Clostridia bacterium]